MATHVTHLVSENMQLKQEVARLSAAAAAPSPSPSSSRFAAAPRGASDGSCKPHAHGNKRAGGKDGDARRDLDSMQSWRTAAPAGPVSMSGGAVAAQPEGALPPPPPRAATHGAEKLIAAAAAASGSAAV